MQIKKVLKTNIQIKNSGDWYEEHAKDWEPKPQECSKSLIEWAFLPPICRSPSNITTPSILSITTPSILSFSFVEKSAPLMPSRSEKTVQ